MKIKIKISKYSFSIFSGYLQERISQISVVFINFIIPVSKDMFFNATQLYTSAYLRSNTSYITFHNNRRTMHF